MMRNNKKMSKHNVTALRLFQKILLTQMLHVIKNGNIKYNVIQVKLS